MGYNVKKGEEPRGTFRTFEDLEVYKVAREFRKKVYAVTRKLPGFEKYEIRRAAVSLTNNIAEGHGRYHFADQVRFFLGSRGSLQELLDDLNVCLDEQYLAPDESGNTKERWLEVPRIDQRVRSLSARSKGRFEISYPGDWRSFDGGRCCRGNVGRGAQRCSLN